MSNDKQTSRLRLGFEIQDVRSLTFVRGDSRYVYAFEASGPRFWDRHGYEAKRISAIIDVGFDDSPWFAFFTEDCIDPPVTVVRAASFEEAYVEYVDNTPALRIDESDLADYPEDSRNYDSSGNPVDTESVQGFELRLVRIECGDTEA